jgi:hypothetical protein
MTTEGEPKKRFIVSIVGLLLVILGVLWITVIFPAIDKLPTDYEQTYVFLGNLTTVDPDTQSTDSFPIKLTLDQEAIGTKDGALLIHEKRTLVRSDTGVDVPDAYGVYGDESTLAIDRRTREFVTDIDEGKRTGYWEPPRPLGEGDTFDLWNPGANKVLEAKYVGSEDFRHKDDVVGVLVFEIDAPDIPTADPETGTPLSYSTKITLWIEPSSGTVVDQDSETIIEADVPALGKTVVQESELRYAEETIVDLMDTAESAHTMLLWARTIIPWLLIGLGAVMVLIDVLVLPRIQARRE